METWDQSENPLAVLPCGIDADSSSCSPSQQRRMAVEREF